MGATTAGRLCQVSTLPGFLSKASARTELPRTAFRILSVLQFCAIVKRFLDVKRASFSQLQIHPQQYAQANGGYQETDGREYKRQHSQDGGAVGGPGAIFDKLGGQLADKQED